MATCMCACTFVHTYSCPESKWTPEQKHVCTSTLLCTSCSLLTNYIILFEKKIHLNRRTSPVVWVTYLCMSGCENIFTRVSTAVSNVSCLFNAWNTSVTRGSACSGSRPKSAQLARLFKACSRTLLTKLLEFRRLCRSHITVEGQKAQQSQKP